MIRHVREVKQVRKVGPCRVCEQPIRGSAISVWVEPDQVGEAWPPYGYRLHPHCATWELRQELNVCEARRRNRKRGKARVERVAEVG